MVGLTAEFYSRKICYAHSPSYSQRSHLKILIKPEHLISSFSRMADVMGGICLEVASVLPVRTL